MSITFPASCEKSLKSTNPSLRSTQPELCAHFAGDIRYRDRFVLTFRVWIRWSRSAAKESFSYQFKNGSTVLGDNLEPCHFPPSWGNIFRGSIDARGRG